MRIGLFTAYGWESGLVGDFSDARIESLANQAITITPTIADVTHRYPAALLTLINARVRFFYCSASDDTDQSWELVQIGFSLEEIHDCLNRPGFSPTEVVRLHLARLREQIELQRKLCERLEAIAAHFQTAEEVSADEFLQTIEAITMTEKYFTPEQQEFIKVRRDEAGEEVLQQKQEDWAKLIAAVRAAMDAGTDPMTDTVQALAKQWVDMVPETTGGDPAVEQSLKRMWDEQGDTLAAQHGSQYDPRPVFGYITRVIARQ